MNKKFLKKNVNNISLILFGIGIFLFLFSVSFNMPFSFVSVFDEPPYWRYETFFSPTPFALTDSCNPNNYETLLYYEDYQFPMNSVTNLKNQSAALCSIEKISGDINSFSLNYYGTANFILNDSKKNFVLSGSKWAGAMNMFMYNYSLQLSSEQEGVVRFNYAKSNPDVSGKPLHVKKMGCPVPSGYQVVIETFVKDFDLTDLRYSPSYFCATMPPMDRESPLPGEWNIYQQLINKQMIPVASNTTKSIFYVIDIENYNVQNVCELGTLDVNTNTCIVEPGLTIVCSQGIFDSENMTCTYSPSSETVCEKGSYDSELNKCVINPEVVNVCNKGVYFEGNCLYYPDTNFVCDDGFSYNTLSGFCEKKVSSLGDIDLFYLIIGFLFVFCAFALKKYKF
jgi:hypothetical protein